jgi:hypothetical protein
VQQDDERAAELRLFAQEAEQTNAVTAIEHGGLTAGEEPFRPAAQPLMLPRRTTGYGLDVSVRE